MSRTYTSIHCDCDPHKIEMKADSLDMSCVLNLVVRETPGDQSGVTAFFPQSMFERLTRAADAFNEAIASEPQSIEEVPVKAMENAI